MILGLLFGLGVFGGAGIAGGDDYNDRMYTVIEEEVVLSKDAASANVVVPGGNGTTTPVTPVTPTTSVNTTQPIVNSGTSGTVVAPSANVSAIRPT